MEMPHDAPRAATGAEGDLASVLDLATDLLHDLEQVTPPPHPSQPQALVFLSVQWERWFNSEVSTSDPSDRPPLNLGCFCHCPEWPPEGTPDQHLAQLGHRGPWGG